VFGVDARALTPALFGGQRRFDQVFFAFPHTGLQGCPARVRESNQDLLREFFSFSARLRRYCRLCRTRRLL
jgi:hypothetical protein